MASRIKTVKFAVPMFTGVVADAVVTNLTQTTLYIPETVTSFNSVSAELGFQDIVTATGGTINEYRIGFSLGSSAYTTVTKTDDITHSGENLAAVLGPFDFTSLFTTSWSGTSMTLDSQVYFDQTTGTTLGMRNVTIVLSITYTYDDTSATQLKTVAIPLESLTTGLQTTANSNIGSNQIPQLTGGGILPEAGVVMRDYYFIIEGNENSAAATDYTISANIDSGTATAFGTQEAGLITDRFTRWVYKPSSVPSLTATHNFQLWSSLASRAFHVTITLYVTYEFTLSSTTRVINSIVVPLEMNSPLGSTSSTNADRFSYELLIAEPGTLTLRQSAFRINFNAAGSPQAYYRAGTQAFRFYGTAVGVAAGMYSLQQRIDSGSAQGLGIIGFGRGAKTFVVEGYSATITEANQPSNIAGYIILNYESDLSSSGIGAHSHTVEEVMISSVSTLELLNTALSYAPVFPETEYRLLSAGFLLYINTTSASMAINLDVKCLGTEGKGGGYYSIYSDAYISDGEVGSTLIWTQGRDVIRRYPSDPTSNRIDFKSARNYRMYSSTVSVAGLSALYTYHSMYIPVTGTISGSAGGTVRINVYRSDTQSIIYTTTRVGNGTFSFNWYDNTIEIYADAYEDTTHYGRSVNLIAGVTSPDISLDTSGGGGGVQVVARAYA